MLDISLFILLFYLKTPTFAALIITAYMKYPILSAEEAAALIADGQTVGIGGFSSVGTPKAVPAALAKHAEALHNEGKPFKIGLITGGATGNQVDSALTEAHAVTFRTPFQSNKEMRGAINSGEVRYFDLHLSQIGQDVRYGFLGKIDVAIIEASDITPEGELILSTSVGISPTLACVADKVIVELNAEHTGKLTGMHDIFVLDNPPYRREIPYPPERNHQANRAERGRLLAERIPPGGYPERIPPLAVGRGKHCQRRARSLGRQPCPPRLLDVYRSYPELRHRPDDERPHPLRGR